MTSIGYLFCLAGLLLFRQVAVGRVKETPTDLRDIVTAALNGDGAGISSVMAQRGTNVDAAPVTDSVPGSTGSSGAVSASTHSDLANKVMELGNAAKGYRFGAVGPTYYDCSGLIWQAAKALGLYKGARFTTSTFDHIAPSWCTKVDTPDTGDIILWPKHHMGISLGGDSMYSARSPSKGIGKSTVSGDSGYFGRKPEYWRVTG